MVKYEGMNREFRIVPESEKLDPEKVYYYDFWRTLSDEILETYGRKILRMSKMYKEGRVEDIDTIVLEEYPPGEAPGKIRHSFHVSDNLVFTYVL